MRAGDTIAVLVAEPPDSLETIVEATATLGPVQATLEPGAEPHTWVGELVIPPNLSLRNQTVEARLVDLAGNVGTRRSQERFTIDTVVNFSITDVEAPPVAAVGDEIVISGEGDANGTARFTIEGIAEDLPMEESPAGTYRGRYTVRAGDLARNARITVQFTNPAGNTLEIEAEETVTVDGVAELYSVAIVGSPARWGDTIVFVVTGEPNSRVRISIPGLITDQEIPELPSQRGTYRGEHRVTRREPLEDAVVRAVLVDPYGNQTINESQRVTILLPDALFLPLQEGINLVGIPIHDPRLERVSDLMELLPAAEMILWQEPTSGAFRAYRRGAPPFGRADGPIQVGAGYIVVMSAPGELVLDGDPGPAEIALRNGVNLITLTRRDPNLRRLSDLADRIGPTVQQVIAYDSSRRRFVAYRVGLPTDAPVNLPVLLGGRLSRCDQSSFGPSAGGPAASFL
ncbi:MAG: hypothetical protein KatS3mg115_0694 [Candidatus Poribacteria bacterium]|nr:MAG: hypothetical protein KatS3mg115_0694 [Candidatus Poribacteria bacterium]